MQIHLLDATYELFRAHFAPRPPRLDPEGVNVSATVGVLKKLVETGQLDPTKETVVINTGMGLKTLDAVADEVSAAATIDPSYAAFAATGIGARD